MATTRIKNGILLASLALSVTTMGFNLATNSNALAQNGGDPFGADPLEVDSFEEDPFGDIDIESDDADSDDPFGEAPAVRKKHRKQIARRKTSTASDDLFGSPAVAAKAKPRNTIRQRMRALGQYGIADETEEFLHIQEVLQEPTQIECNEEPIADVAAMICELHEIPILFDTRALNEESIDPSSEPVSLNVSNIKLKNALALLLNELDLTTVVRNEVLMITSQSKAEEEVSTRTYRIDERWKLSDQELADLFKTMAHPDSWSAVGGKGEVQPVKDGVIVSNSYVVHRKISKILAQLDQLHASD